MCIILILASSEKDRQIRMLVMAVVLHRHAADPDTILPDVRTGQVARTRYDGDVSLA
jgi:hypothetical protein